ncbi:MAG: ribosome maturation factor RimP [Myxococcota bacterium]|nr:ribosome maturation factor RimP [Myxococcota bacterium]
MTEKDLNDLIRKVDDLVSDLGFELVDIRKRGNQQRIHIQIRVDRPDSAPGHGITADDCAVVSRAVEAWLDESKVLGERYVLEVSSPGIERPVRWPKHWRRYIGHDVRVRLPNAGQTGKKRVKATIVAVNDDDSVVLRLKKDGKDTTVAPTEGLEATLVVDWSKVDGSSEGTDRKESQ